MSANRTLLHTGRLVVLVLANLIAFGISAGHAQESNTAKPSNQKWNYDELKSVPEKMRAKANPLANDSDAVQAAGKLFERHCADCHGTKAAGGKRGPSPLQEEVQQAAPGTLFWILTNGVVRHGMPVWSKLPEPQRWQIIAFLQSFKTLQKPAGPE